MKKIILMKNIRSYIIRSSMFILLSFSLSTFGYASGSSEPARGRASSETASSDPLALFENYYWRPIEFEIATPEIFERIAGGTLAVLPFAGGNNGDGETIAELFSFDRIINQVFRPIPRTSIIAAMRQERYFQLAYGMTDPDSAVALGRELGARFVITGNITRLGDRNLLVVSILNTETLELIAGDIQTYVDIEEITEKLPFMTQKIARGTKQVSNGLPKLAVVPFAFEGEDAARDVLAQILAIYLQRKGKYAIYPRTINLNQVQVEWQNQLTGDTADNNIVRIGAGENPRYALSGAARRLGNTTMFNASIIDLESGAQIDGHSVRYSTLNEGIEVVEFLAANFSGVVMNVSSNEGLRSAVAAINNSGAGSYFVVVRGNVRVDRTVEFHQNAVKTITILGDERLRGVLTTAYEYTGSQMFQTASPLFVVPHGITLTLGNNLTIEHHPLGSASNTIVVIGGTLILRDGATLDAGGWEDDRPYGGNRGAAVLVRNGGVFFMEGGKITGNGGIRAGGVLIFDSTFFMSGGTISDNHALGVLETLNWDTRDAAGGVAIVGGQALFRMSGGIISDNVSDDIWGAGGVSINGGGIFIKTGGIISDSNVSSNFRFRVVNNTAGGRWRARTSGLNDNMDSRIDGPAGGWDLR
jgi:TolB-like protein